MKLLAALGLTFILKQGRILNEIRSFLISLHPLIKDLFECGMCLGFWSGIIIGILCCLNFSEIIILGFSTSFCGFLTQHFLVVLSTFFKKLQNK